MNKPEAKHADLKKVLLLRVIRENIDFTMTELKTTFENGYSLAHELVRSGKGFDDFEILSIANHIGWSVAHEMAKGGHKFEDLKILQLTTRNGVTVAHTMSRNGAIFADEKIRNMKTREGVTVEEVYGTAL